MKATVSIDSKRELRRECDTPRPSATPLQEGMGCRITLTINDALPRHPLLERGEGTASGRSDSEAVNKMKRRGVSHPKGSISLHFPRCASAYIAFLLILLFTGCRSHKELQRTDGGKTDSTSAVVRPKPTVKPKPLDYEAIENVEFNSYHANFSCNVNGITVNGQIRMAKDSIIWVSINKIIEIGRAKLTPDRVQVNVKLLNKNYDGDYAGLKRQWDIDIDYATAEALLTGNRPPQCSKSKDPIRTGDTATLYYTQGKEHRQLTLKKNLTTKQLTEAEMYSPSNGQRINLIYSQRQTVDGQRLPTSIGVKIKSSNINEQTVIKLDKLKLNENQSYPFK